MLRIFFFQIFVDDAGFVDDGFHRQRLWAPFRRDSAVEIRASFARRPSNPPQSIHREAAFPPVPPLRDDNLERFGNRKVLSLFVVLFLSAPGLGFSNLEWP